jgi:catechol 2,3-dioxygenase-like lactoylglutathione lyase family enzyme
MAIFTHVVVGTNDLKKATKFYDATLGTLGVKRIAPLGDHAFMYGKESPEFMVTKPRNGNPACHANGGTVGFVAPNRKAVHEFHKAGLANGGMDEGQPGPREILPNAYAAYLRDPDGNKICTYCFAPEK